MPKTIPEATIENWIVEHLDDLGYSKAGILRRCSTGDGFGSVDLLLLPPKGRHRIVQIEVKRSSAPDATARVVGQLLLYYAGAMRIGHHGLRQLKQYCERNQDKARSTSRKSLRELMGRMNTEASSRRIKHGSRLEPTDVGMFIALDGPPHQKLKDILTTLSRRHGIRIGVITARPGGLGKPWMPGPTRRV